MTTPAIDTLPAAPQRAQAPDDFAAQADRFAAALPPLVQQTNTALGWIAGSLETIAADREQTGLDRQATGEDRAATQADRQQTGLDRQATAADRIQTGKDVQATAADREQTGEDKATAGQSAEAAAASESLASRWASEAPDVEVKPGQYSARHWAEQAKDRVINGAALSDFGPGEWAPLAADAVLERNGWYAVDFSSGPLTLTLPAAPAANSTVQLYVAAGSTRDSVIERNGETIMGLNENLTLDRDILSLKLVYSGTTWRLLS